MVNESTIRGLQAAIRRLEAEKREIQRQHDALVTALRYLEESEQVATPPRQRTEKNMRVAVAEILAVEGPLSRRDIHDRLLEQGVHVGGRDPVNNVGAHLSIDPRFVKMGGGLWGLAENADDGAERDDRNDGLDSDDYDEEDSVAW